MHLAAILFQNPSTTITFKHCFFYIIVLVQFVMILLKPETIVNY